MARRPTIAEQLAQAESLRAEEMRETRAIITHVRIGRREPQAAPHDEQPTQPDRPRRRTLLDTITAGHPTGQAGGQATGQAKGQAKGQAGDQPTGQPVGQAGGQAVITSQTITADYSCINCESSQIPDGYTRNQWLVILFASSIGHRVTTFPEIGERTGLTKDSARKALRSLEARGALSFHLKRVCTRTGIQIVLSPDVEGQAGGHPAGQPEGQAGGQAKGHPAGQAGGQAEVHLKILNQEKEEDKNLSSGIDTRKRTADAIDLSPDALATRWPTLVGHGFTAMQAQQALEVLLKGNGDASRFTQGLDHAEWELRTKGNLYDASGQVVLSVAGYVYRSLSRTGYYRCPKGYLTHEEQAVADAQRKEREEARRRDDEAFRAWWDGLTQDRRDQIDERRLGPAEQWRKSQWRKIMGRG